MKKFVILGVLLLVGFGCDRDAGDSEQQVIRVNGTWLMKNDVEQLVTMLREQLRRERPEEVLFGSDDMRRKAARELIINHLMLEQALQTGITIPDSVVEAALRAIRRQFGEEQFRQQMTASGQTEEDVRGYVREGMIIDSLLKSVMRVDSVTETQCRDYYEENAERFQKRGRVRARQILLRCDSSVSPEQQSAKHELAAQLLRRARAGEDFASLAKAHSEGPNAAKGGDVGWFTRGDLLPEIEQAAFGLRSGETSDVVRSAFGYHLIQKTGEEAPAQLSYDEVAGDIRKGLTLRRQTKRLRSYTDSLVSTATVEYADSAYAPVGDVSG